LLVKVGIFDLADGETFRQVQADYELVRKTLTAEGPAGLNGWMGNFVQPRTKGPGGAVKSHAFYARTMFVARMLRLSELQ
jgi:DNA mismatch repair protein MutH